MDKLQLPTVSLICVDCIDVKRAVKVLDRCKEMCDFGAVKLLTSDDVDYEHKIEIMPLNSLIAYSIFCLTKLYQYINTSHLLIVQRDGWILNPQSFKRAWLDLDFIGGIYMQYNLVGSGGFSLRSKRIMQEVSETLPDWDGTQEHAEVLQKICGYYEDGVLTLSSFAKKFNIASLDEAADFSQAGNRDPLYFRENPFGWHRTWQTIDFVTGLVDSSDAGRDIHVSYDKEIDEL